MTLSQVQQTALRKLPSIDQLLTWPTIAPLVVQYGHDNLVLSARHALDQQRAHIMQGQNGGVLQQADLVNTIETHLTLQFAPTLKPVINATGVIIHTNLGRAPLSQPALDAIQAVASGYSNLEYELASGKRGSRSTHAADLITELSGADSATVVNNAASAVLLMLSALCHGREVIISRGQQVEIGGGFRMPDVMRQAGCMLVEVGTTNRTHLRDYRDAITENTAAILVVHHSNFKVVGFTAEPSLAELSALAHEHNLPLLYDQGSGALRDLTRFGLAPERLVQESVAAGCDIVAYSGDKLLGGPQAGLICGRAELIAQIKRHPLARAVRPDKLTYAALTATLLAYATGKECEEIPVWWMLSRPLTELATKAKAWRRQLQKASANLSVSVIDGESAVGGGTTPGQALPTHLLAIACPEPDKFAAKLREHNLAVITRIQSDMILIDPRTVLPHQEKSLMMALIQTTQGFA